MGWLSDLQPSRTPATAAPPDDALAYVSAASASMGPAAQPYTPMPPVSYDFPQDVRPEPINYGGQQWQNVNPVSGQLRPPDYIPATPPFSAPQSPMQPGQMGLSSDTVSRVSDWYGSIPKTESGLPIMNPFYPKTLEEQNQYSQEWADISQDPLKTLAMVGPMEALRIPTTLASGVSNILGTVPKVGPALVTGLGTMADTSMGIMPGAFSQLGSVIKSSPAVQKIVNSWGPKLEELATIFEKWVFGQENARINKLGSRAVQATEGAAQYGRQVLKAGNRGESVVEMKGALIKGAKGNAERIVTRAMTSLGNIVGKNKQVIKDFDEYFNATWMLKHLEELKQADPNFPIEIDGWIFKTVQDIQQTLGAIKGQVGAGTYAKMIMGARMLANEATALMMQSQEKTAAFKQAAYSKYQYYFPMIPDMKNKAAVNEFFQRASSFLKPMGAGVTGKVKNPLEEFGTMISKRVKVNAENDYIASIAEAIQWDPKYRDFVSITTGKQKPSQTAIKFFDNGIQKWINFAPEAEKVYLDLINYLDPGSGIINPNPAVRFIMGLNEVSQRLGILQTVQRAAFTTFSPAFIVANFIGDALNLWMKEGIGPRGYIPALVENLLDVWKEGKYNEILRKAGMTVGGTWAKEITTGTPKKVITTNKWLKFLNPLEVIKYIGTAVEQTPRTATGMKYLKAGETAEYAALRGRRVNPDYDSFSILSRALNGLYLFFNAGVQGFKIPFTALRENPGGTTARLGTLLAGVAGVNYWNTKFPSYWNINLYDRMNSLIIMTGEHTDSKGNLQAEYIRLVPMLRQWGLFTGPLQYALEVMNKQNPASVQDFLAYLTSDYGKFETGKAAEAWQTGWNPLTSFTGAGGYLPTQLLQTIVSAEKNYDDFRKRKIVPDELLAKPINEQFDEQTSKTAIALSYAFNKAPLTIEFYITDSAGTASKDVLNIIDMALGQYYKQTLDPVIANHVLALKDIAVKAVDGNQIKIQRKDYLNKLQPADREKVLTAERLSPDKIPILNGIISRVYKQTTSDQERSLANEYALQKRGNVAENVPLDELRAAADKNANDYLSGKIDSNQYDKNRSYYRAVYSGASGQEWSEAEVSGAIPTSETEKYLPASKQGPAEFKALNAYHEIMAREIQKYPVLSSENYKKIENAVRKELTITYGKPATDYAFMHKDDWIYNLTPKAQQVERNREQQIAQETWFGKNYYSMSSTPKTITKPKYVNLAEE